MDTQVNTSLEEVVKDVIDEFCDDLESFTSLDVSNKVKQDHLPDVRHREVARLVRNLFFNEDYIKEFDYNKSNIMVSLPSGQSAMAYLYHHETVDPGDYQNRSQLAVRPTTAADNPQPAADRRSLADAVAQGSQRRSIFDVAGTTPPQTQPAAQVPGQSLTRAQKADCRLEIPPSWVAACGWTPGTTVYATAGVDDDDGEHFISLLGADDVTPDHEVLDTMLVNIDGRLRLTKRALDKSDLDHGAGCNLLIELLDNCIIVS